MSPDPESISYLPRVLDKLVTAEFRQACEFLGETYGRRAKQASMRGLTILRKDFLAAIRSIPAEYVRPHLIGHFDRVGDLCRRIALEMGRGVQEADDFQAGGSLHDIGKILYMGSSDSRPDNIKTPFRVRYLTVIRLHPILGALLLESVSPLMDFAIPFVKEHHEGVSGTGYPIRLNKDRVSIQGETAFLADCYDAIMTRWQDRRPSPPSKQEMLEVFTEDYQSAGCEASAALQAYRRVVERDHEILYPDG